jgi:cytochrome P450
MSTTELTLDDIDLADHDNFAEHTPHEMFALLRREDPVHWSREPTGPGFWSITRYQHIDEVHKDWETFSSEVGGTSLQDLEPDQVEARKSMIDMDPPRHNHLRGLVNKRFTPRAVLKYEEYIRKLFRTILDDTLPRGEFDFVHEVSAELPMRVFAEMLGVPLEDRRYIIELGDKLLGATDPEYGETHELDVHRDLPFSSPVALEMFDYGQKLARDRRTDPRDDIVTALVQAEIDGNPLTEREYNVYFLLLATAGNETTRHTITHGLLALMQHPEQMQMLRDGAGDDALFKSAAEEILRWATPVYHFRRTATRDVEFHGKEIRAGDKIATWLVSGNRDEEAFERPHEFDITRSPNKHITFGPGGIHFCLGAHLARLEVKIAFEELLPRVKHVEPAGKAEKLRSNFFNGIKRMPVKVEVA